MASNVQFEQSLDDAARSARKAGKPILLDFVLLPG